MSPEVDKISSKHRNPVPYRNVTDGPYRLARTRSSVMHRKQNCHCEYANCE